MYEKFYVFEKYPIVLRSVKAVLIFQIFQIVLVPLKSINLSIESVNTSFVLFFCLPVPHGRDRGR